MGAPISSWPLRCGFNPAGFGRSGSFSEALRGLHVLNVQQSQTAINSGRAGTSPQQ